MLLLQVATSLSLAVSSGDSSGYQQFETEDPASFRATTEFAYPKLPHFERGSEDNVEPKMVNFNDTVTYDPGLNLQEPAGVTHLINLDVDPVGDDMEGYRVQVYAGPNLEKANNTRADFVEQYPGVKTYRLWVQPTFRVRCGNFVSRREATIFMNEIRKSFPQAFVVGDRIKKPKIRRNVGEIKEEDLKTSPEKAPGRSGSGGQY